MKPLKIINLVWILVRIFFKYGNVMVYYHVIGGAKDVPIEVEAVEIRRTLSRGNLVTIY